MSEKIKVYVLYIISGVIVSLVSGVYMQDLSSGVGALIIGYGLPMPWLERTTVVVPGTPSHYSLSWYGLGLLADIIFWSIIVGIVHILYKQLRK
ncbi:MAG: hypothetical protein OEY31_13685 [Candidatus Bathyarchaeota archaeon]|nr:hypothetical protein [Candidatus Bathyarchaeota archaeon]MDH5780517.1 hypothetical protein [Candidatus Bathyarchaeota archaeon]